MRMRKGFRMPGARFDKPGMRIGGRGPNILAAPTDLSNAAWIAQEVTKSSTGMTETTGSTGHFVSQAGIVYTLGQVWTLDAEAKPNGANSIQLVFPSAPLGANAWANFNLGTGAVGTVGSAVTAAMQALDSGYYRCRITGAATASGTSVGGVVAFCQGDNAATATRLAAYVGSTSRALLIRRVDQFRGR